MQEAYHKHNEPINSVKQITCVRPTKHATNNCPAIGAGTAILQGILRTKVIESWRTNPMKYKSTHGPSAFAGQQCHGTFVKFERQPAVLLLKSSVLPTSSQQPFLRFAYKFGSYIDIIPSSHPA
jgi:hypothetical protein